MPVDIRNVTARPVFVPLNSGRHLRLSPGEVTGNIPDVEVNNNAKIAKLTNRRSIAVVTHTASDAQTRMDDSSTSPASGKRAGR